MVVTINNRKYKVLKNYKDALDANLLEDLLTDYFDDYDYIVGDIAYGKVRLKGFNEKTNKHFNAINDISLLDEYIRDYCAHGCKWFMISEIKS